MADAIEPTVKPAQGEPVHLMLTCLCDAFYPAVGMAAVECLESVGYPVIFDEVQSCCAQPAFNCGDRESARKVARHTLRVFREALAVVVPSGSCAAMIRWGYPQLFEKEPDFQEACELAGRTWELSEFLAQVNGTHSWPGSYPKKIAFHRSCHLRELSPGVSPERLLESIEGLQCLWVASPEQCCGFGGTFSVSFPWTSQQIGCAKLESLLDSGAQEVVSSDMGCLMHLHGLWEKENREGRFRERIPMRHYAEVLRDSLDASRET